MSLVPTDLPTRPNHHFFPPFTYVFHFVTADSHIVASFKRQKGKKDVVVAKDVESVDYYRCHGPEQAARVFRQMGEALTKASPVDKFPIPIGSRYMVMAIIGHRNQLGDVLYRFDLEQNMPEMTWTQPTIEGYVMSMPPFLGIRPPFYQNGASE